jgi:putative transposase
VEAAVVLPDHLHAIWTLPDGDADFALRWRLIKSDFSDALSRGEPISDSRASKGERGIWQRRYWEHTLRPRGFQSAPRLDPLQSGEARLCDASE